MIFISVVIELTIIKIMDFLRIDADLPNHYQYR